MEIHIKNAIILCKFFIINATISNAFEYKFNTGYTLIIKVVYRWQLNKVP